MNILRLLSSVFGFFHGILEWLKERRMIQAARQKAESDIIIQNEKKTREANEILAERRSRDDVVDRLRRGDF